MRQCVMFDDIGSLAWFAIAYSRGIWGDAQRGDDAAWEAYLDAVLPPPYAPGKEPRQSADDGDG